MQILFFIIGGLVLFFLLCWMIGKALVFLTELPDSKKRKTAKYDLEQKHLEEQKRKQEAVERPEKARLLQSKFENSEFCELIVAFVLENYYLRTCDSKDEFQTNKYDNHFTLEKEYVYIRPGVSLTFQNNEYRKLRDDTELMACAYAIQSKLKHHWGNDTKVELEYHEGGFGDSSCVWIICFKTKGLKDLY